MSPFEGVTAPSQDSDTSATGGSHRSENTSSLDGQWSPVPTSVDPNRPDYSTPPTPSAVPVVNNGGTIDTAALVGITISAVIIVLAVVITIIWWTRTRSKNRHGFGHGQQRQQRPRVIEEEEEKPPTYEAAVFGIYRNDQTIPAQQSFPTPLPQALPHSNYSDPTRPFHAVAPNRTLRLDTTVLHQNISQQHSDIVIYPHDSPPPTPTLPEQNPLPIRPSEQEDQGHRNNVVSHHITDFSEDYPDTVSFNSDFSDNEPTSAAEIV
ncbi:uncharacterized protein LAJ45_03245 [Morchella importuna]|uniref:Uncharacterized protein n=1 Tax=Morchella conica CCBAS932 TaxID=1392247 RepID=A0A3N4KTH2_9PEZI|nr:uncharacterized protein LAJ45_03245 [Morchella importuna]KAH8152405.1 hypothetical protein LAJ45_03245 [Morchella importuna]RPB13810.1 hypothetical protein P167DRAFT_573106 [Morchella conica CCBAS932]